MLFQNKINKICILNNRSIISIHILKPTVKFSDYFIEILYYDEQVYTY